MSYLRKIEYRIVPKNSYEIYRNCQGCGCKINFYNTNCFRVNANGSILKHEYEEFLCNSPKLAFEYGTNITLFLNNRVEIDRESLKYELKIMFNSNDNDIFIYEKGDTIFIHNDYFLKVRVDKILANILNVSRNRVKELLKDHIISIVEMDYGLKFKIKIHGEI